MALRIVTFNIQHGRGIDGMVDRGRLANAVALLGADLLALQEVDVGLRRSARVDEARLAADATGLVATFGGAHRVGWWGRYGNAVLTRGGADLRRVRFPRSGHSERRGALVGRVGLGAVEVSVAAAHLSVERAEALRQLDILVAALGRHPTPRVLVGDLNLGPDDVRPVLGAAGMTLAGGPPTFPASTPRLRIDHVAVQGLTIESVVVPESSVSDHRPLIVEVS
jgi:endonuclease/exonuclease/phosphatase family metal-dependent hydrolase